MLYGILMFSFHPACVRAAFGLRHIPSPYRKLYCLAMPILTMRGVMSSRKILFRLGVAATSMFITVLLMPTLS